MIHNLLNSSLFYINTKGIQQISLNKGEWIVTNDLSSGFLEEIKSGNYKLVFIKRENIFSHAMNVLRKVLLDTNIAAVVGAEFIFEILENAESCVINVSYNKIFVSDNEYEFRDFSYVLDSSEIIEYNMNKKEICYKPDYYYERELSDLIVKGYSMADKIFPYKHESRCDQEGRVWNGGFIFPKQFYEYFFENKEKYYKILLEYVEVLKLLFSMRNCQEETEELKCALIKHYLYSITFSFIIANIAEELKDVVGEGEIERIYNLFVMNSPIHNKYELTENALVKMESFLKNILSGIDNIENYEMVYQADIMPPHNIALMYFVTNMFSDIRRCVINVIIENNPWFEAIYQHRKDRKIY